MLFKYHALWKKSTMKRKLRRIRIEMLIF